MNKDDIAMELGLKVYDVSKRIGKPNQELRDRLQAYSRKLGWYKQAEKQIANLGFEVGQTVMAKVPKNHAREHPVMNLFRCNYISGARHVIGILTLDKNAPHPMFPICIATDNYNYWLPPNVGANDIRKPKS